MSIKELTKIRTFPSYFEKLISGKNTVFNNQPTQNFIRKVNSPG
jgi:hypothetical protein